LKQLTAVYVVFNITQKYLTNMLSRAEFNRNMQLYLDAHRFCVDHGVFVYAGAIPNRINTLYVEVNDHGKIQRGKEYYTNEEAQLKIYEIYLHIYKKMSNLHAQN